MSARIYKVTTPSGWRLVEATTKGQAINHCVGTDYNAEPISSSDLYAAMQAGAQVEKAAVSKKSDGGEPSTSPEMPAFSPPAQPQSNASTQRAASAPLPSMPQASTAPNQAGGSIVDGMPRPPGWVPPAPASGVQAVLAEQQRINPAAAAAAGVGPAPIIAPRPAEDTK